MKKKLVMLFCAAALSCAVIAGCGGSGTASDAESETEEETEDEVPEDEEEAADDSEAAEDDTDEADEDADEDVPEAMVEPDAADEDAEETAAVTLEDGVYSAEFDTDSSMFHVNEAYDGIGTLTVENGEMTIHVSLVSKNIINLYVGLAEDAQAEGAVLLEPTVDEVTYSDGYTEEVYGFDIPVEVLDEEFDLAILGTKGTWYDHKVSVSNPVLLDESAEGTE